MISGTGRGLRQGARFQPAKRATEALTQAFETLAEVSVAPFGGFLGGGGTLSTGSAPFARSSLRSLHPWLQSLARFAGWDPPQMPIIVSLREVRLKPATHSSSTPIPALKGGARDNSLLKQATPPW